MTKDSIFIVIEGLDGSGKTTVSKKLAKFLETELNKKVKSTFEPNDYSCAGTFIRQTLTKELTNISPRTLMLAFAANRMDHNHRLINKWLDEGSDKIIICDRYYLSSLVYQSNEEISMEEVMELNQHARKPDIIFFMDVDDEVCYQRMDVRDKPRELFEENLSATRQKYTAAINFLQETRAENVVYIDANGTVEEVFQLMLDQVLEFKK